MVAMTNVIAPIRIATVLSILPTSSTGSKMYFPKIARLPPVTTTDTIENAMKFTDRPPQKFASRTARVFGGEAGEVAVVEHQRGEVRDGQRDRREEAVDHAAEVGLLRGEVEGDVAAGLDQHPHRQAEHDDPDRGSGEVDELAHGVHAAAEQGQLQGGEHEERDPAQRGEPEDAAVGHRRELRPHPQQQHDQATEASQVWIPYQKTAITARTRAGMLAPKTPKLARASTGYGTPVRWPA